MRESTLTLHHIGIREAVSLVVVLTTAKVFLGLPRSLAEQGGPAAWLILLICLSHGPFIWLGVRGVIMLHPGRSLITATELILGPILGTLVNLSYFIYFAFLTTTVVREYSESMKSVFLRETPLPVLVAVLLGASIYLGYLGIEGLARTCWLGGPFMLIGLATLLMMGYSTHAEPNALYPIFGLGLGRVVGWGVIKDLIGDLLFLGIIAPAFRGPKAWNKTFFASWALIAAIMLSSVIVVEYVFPYPASDRITIPLMQMSRVISLGPGIQRVESVFFLIWLVAGVLKLAAASVASASVLAQVLRLPGYRHVLLPIGIILFSIARIPGNMTQVFIWDEVLRNFGAIVSVIFPLLTWLVGLIRKGVKARAAAASQA